MKSQTSFIGIQPDWVCSSCGEKWGQWWDKGDYTGPVPHFATYHMDECNVCGKTASVTEARDFGYLKSGWDRKKD